MVIPVYRSATTLCELADRLHRVLRNVGIAYEIVFVDDSSPDSSWDALCRLHAGDPEHVSVIQLMRNFGQHNALMCGFRHARGKYVITMDDDLQHPPEELPKLLTAIEETGADVVYGVPERKQHRVWRNAGSMLAAAFYRMVFRLGIQPSAFRIVRKEVIDAVLRYTLNFTYIDGLLAWHTQRIEQIEVDHRPRTAGRSGYSIRSLLVLAFNLLTNFSLLPLQFVSLMGILAALGGLALGTCYLVLYLLSRIAAPGYASTIVAVLVLGGVQLLALGIQGEYLGRLHLNVNRKPQYTVRSLMEPSGSGGKGESRR